MGILDTLKDSILKNPVLKEYNVGDKHFTCGINQLWNVYSSRSKKTGEEVSVFILDKKKLNYLDAIEKKVVIDTLVHGLRALETLKHPNIIPVKTPVYDTKDVVAFATEHLLSSFSTFMDDTYEDDENLEIYFNLLHILEAVNYIHTNFKMSVGYISQVNVVVTSNGNWKLSCLDFIHQHGRNELIERFKKCHKIFRTVAGYLAPETINQSQTDEHSDVFSFGLLVLSIFNRKLSEFKYDIANFENRDAFYRKIQDITNPYFKNISPQFSDTVISTVSSYPDLRPSIFAIFKNPIFNTVDIVVERSILAFDSMIPAEKETFASLLIKSIDSVNAKLLETRLLPFFQEKLGFPSHTYHSLRVLFAISSKIPKHKFKYTVLPSILNTFNRNENEIKLLLFENFKFLLDSIDSKELIQGKMINLIKGGLTFKDDAIQISSLKALKECLNNEDIILMAPFIYPALNECLSKAETLSVQVNSIICLSELIPHLRNSFDVNNLISNLCSMKSKEVAFIMSMLGAINKAFTHFQKDITLKCLTCSVIPYVLKNTQFESLNKSQLEMHFAIVKKMVEVAHHKALDSIEKSKDAPLSLLKEGLQNAENSRIEKVEPVFNDGSSSTKNLLNLLGNFAYKEDFDIITRVESSIKTGRERKTSQSTVNALPNYDYANSNKPNSVFAKNQPVSFASSVYSNATKDDVEWGDFKEPDPIDFTYSNKSDVKNVWASQAQTSKYDALREIEPFNPQFSTMPNNISSFSMNTPVLMMPQNVFENKPYSLSHPPKPQTSAKSKEYDTEELEKLFL